MKNKGKIRIEPLTQVLILLGTNGESRVAACRFLLSKLKLASSAAVRPFTVTVLPGRFSSLATYNVLLGVPY